MSMEEIQKQLDLKLVSVTLPQNMFFVKIIEATAPVEIECGGLNSSSTFGIVFQNFSFLGDVLDTRRHMVSFVKKQYDVALYYQSKMDKLRKRKGQNLDSRMNINLLEWFTISNKAFRLFLKIKAFGIDPTDEMMKSAFGLVTHRIEHLREEVID